MNRISRRDFNEGWMRSEKFSAISPPNRWSGESLYAEGFILHEAIRFSFTDEAGSHANAQLFRSVAAIFRSIQLRALPLRTLTLGILIVSGGTLAALPFRRYQAIPDASSAPAQVTGPTHSALDRSDSGSGVLNALVNGESAGSAAATSQMLSARLPCWPERAAPQPPRRIDIPLSYEDLALPIDQPVALDRRFNATVTVREKQLERERVAALVMPAMESLAASQQAELLQAADAISADDSATRHAAGSLASTSLRETNTELLPKADRVERDRHWIRQPQ